MRPPDPAPKLETLMPRMTQEIMLAALNNRNQGAESAEYWHWDDLKYRQPPAELGSRENWWLMLQCQRLMVARDLTGLTDTSGETWRVALTHAIQSHLSALDRQMAVRVLTTQPETLGPDLRDQFVVDYLTQEAWASSFIEGAAATREQASDLVTKGRAPANTSERMVLNNFHALEQVRQWKGQPLTPEMVLALQAQLVEQTDVKAEDVGRLRLRQVVVSTEENIVLHEPPAFEELPRRLRALCDFANAEDGLHPIVRSVVLHFMLAYDHPFGDGNGRTARALFYWSMLRHGYWLVEFMPISDVIRRAPKQYGQAFLRAETDNQDFTHFLAYHLDALDKANLQFAAHVERQRTAQKKVEAATDVPGLNLRQRTVLRRLLTGETKWIAFETHQRDHRVTYLTARKDLEGLLARGLLAERPKEGRRRLFGAPKRLAEVLAQQVKSPTIPA